MGGANNSFGVTYMISKILKTLATKSNVDKDIVSISIIDLFDTSEIVFVIDDAGNFVVDDAGNFVITGTSGGITNRISYKSQIYKNM